MKAFWTLNLSFHLSLFLLKMESWTPEYTCFKSLIVSLMNYLMFLFGVSVNKTISNFILDSFQYSDSSPKGTATVWEKGAGGVRNLAFGMLRMP